VRRAIALATTVLALTACDKVYFVRIDAGPYSPAQVSVAPLAPDERERAVSVFRATAKELGLSCAPAKYPIVTDSYDVSQYQLFSCSGEGDFTQVQLADSLTHVSVEIQKICGLGEPASFRRYRTRFAEAFGAAFPTGRVTVRYPYDWGRKARGQR
jgi:hypothetical protein